jgi:Gly-Xaa carboxypeptidase
MGRPELPVYDEAPRRRSWAKPLFAVLCLLLLPVLYPSTRGAFMDAVACPHAMAKLKSNPNKHAGKCEQPAALAPSWDVSSLMEGKKDRIVTWLSNAVKIPTEIFDVMGPVGEDKRWDVFYEFAECAL